VACIRFEVIIPPDPTIEHNQLQDATTFGVENKCMKKALKKAGYRVYKWMAPKWCTEVLVTKADVLEALEFWDHFNIPMHPTLAKMRRIISKGSYGSLTLKHQKLIVRCILSDIAMKGCAAFKDEMFNDITVECGENLVQANRADAARNAVKRK
jgi:hypothetical protein